MTIKPPNWLQEQVGIRYRSEAARGAGSGWLGRRPLTRKYCDYLIESGQPVTIDAIREMLRFVDRDYSLKSDQIVASLAGMRRCGLVAKVIQGSAVTIARRKYPSIRAAAETEGVAPQTVINRIESKDKKWRGWRYVD